jgi:hypothetical protein
MCFLIAVADCYYPVAAEVFLFSVGLRNVFGFGIGYAITPWIAAVGYQNAFGTMAAIHCAILGLGLPLWYWGKKIRNATARWKVINW